MLVAMKAQIAKRGMMSPSLLENIPEKRSKDAHKRMCLGMGEWTESSSGEEKENALPSRKPFKKLKLSKKESSGERWHFISDDEEEDLGKKFVPKNTAASTKWVLANFNRWRQSRNKRFSGNPEKQVPGNFLEGTDDPATLCKWLTLYIAETRKQDGSKYSPKTLYSLLTGLLWHSHAQNPNCPPVTTPNVSRSRPMQLTMHAPQMPPMQPTTHAPQMNFAGCSIVIYQGNSAPAVPPLPPHPVVAARGQPTVSDHELDDLDLDMFVSDF